MINITKHAIDHWLGRCRMKSGLSRGSERQRMRLVIEQESRMATKDEARAISLWVNRARFRNSISAWAISSDRLLVADDHDVAFVLAFDGGEVHVTTCLVASKALRFARGLNHRSLRTMKHGAKECV